MANMTEIIEFHPKGSGQLPESSYIKAMQWSPNAQYQLKVLFLNGALWEYNVCQLESDYLGLIWDRLTGRKPYFDMTPGMIFSRFVKDKCDAQKVADASE